MLGRQTYTPEELATAAGALRGQLDAYDAFLAALGPAADAPDVSAARAAFEARLFVSLTLVLDRYFVHRIRSVVGKDGNPLNEVELLTESLMSNDGVLQGNNVIKYVPEKSVVGLAVGDRIRLTAEQFEQLCRAFLDEIERRFVKEG